MSGHGLFSLQFLYSVVRNPFEALAGFEGLAESRNENPGRAKKKKSFPQGRCLKYWRNV
jgi:hypothetical protein